MITIRIIKVKNIINEEIIMTIAMTKVIIATIIMATIIIIMMIMKIKIGNRIKI